MSTQVKTLIGNRLIVKEVKEELKQTEGGIILAQLENANVPKKGVVINIGLEVADYIDRYKGKPIREGVIILYDNTQYQQLMDNTTPLDIIDLSNLIAVCGQ